MHAGFRQAFGDPDLVVFGEDDAGLLLAIAQGDVVDLDLLGEMELSADGVVEVPGADKPFICFPGFLRHGTFLQISLRFVARGFRDFRVDGIPRRFTAQYAKHFFRGLGLQIQQRFFRIKTGVRREDDIVAPE